MGTKKGGGLAKPSPLLYGTIRVPFRTESLASISIWLVAVTLEVIPLVRALTKHLLKPYRVFYSYLAFVLLRDVWLFAIYFHWPKSYPFAYWSSEILSVFLGCGLVWEVYRIALVRYPGTARVARNLLLFLFIVAAARIFVKAWNSPNWIPQRTTLELEIDLRLVQLALLLGLLFLFAYYAIPLGRNLNGIIYGYSLFLVTSVSAFFLRHWFGAGFQQFWQYSQPISYSVVLLVWGRALWSYAPVPKSDSQSSLEIDYQALVAGTKGKLQYAREHLLRGIRS